MKKNSGQAVPMILLLCVLTIAVGGCQANADSASRGKQIFATCAECHGESGEGNFSIGAPNIAGMNAWYLETELHKFRAGVRGAQFDDLEGMRMRPMSQSLQNDDEVKAVAAYVASLPPVRHAPILGGDAQAGKRRYAICAGCHGTDGKGNEAVKAPRLFRRGRLVYRDRDEEISQRRARRRPERYGRLGDGAHDASAE